MTEISPYYKNSAEKIPLTSKISYSARKKMFDIFIAQMNFNENSSVLDVGVTSDDQFNESNYFEQFYPYKNKIVCVGTEDGSHLEKKYPGLKFLLVRPGEKLPFSDQSFDIVFSNAVVEHVGNKQNQQFFIGELLRVSKHFFMTTPNRWFPVELHTSLPLLHWLPKGKYRKLLSRLGLNYWAKEENLNLLDKRGFFEVFPQDVSVEITSIRTFGFRSNLIAYGKSRL